MTREDFCNLMAEAKETSKLNSSQIAASMNMLSPDVRRFEKGRHNFNLKLVINYLHHIGCILHLQYANSTYVCECYEVLLDTMVEIRKKEGKSQRSLADLTSLSFVGIAYFEMQKTTIRIDNFLRICDAMGIAISIERKEA